MWGFSPAANLLAEAEYEGKDGEPVEILVMNSCDIRHVLKTGEAGMRDDITTSLHQRFIIAYLTPPPKPTIF